MKQITVAELRQNPTAALREVESGETYVVTRHRRAVAQLVPPVAEALVVVTPPLKRGASPIATLGALELRTAGSVEELIEDMRSQW